MTPGALPPAPARRLEVVLEAVVAEGRLTHIDDEVDGAPTPTVTAVGATARHIRLGRKEDAPSPPLPAVRVSETRSRNMARVDRCLTSGERPGVPRRRRGRASRASVHQHVSEGAQAATHAWV